MIYLIEIIIKSMLFIILKLMAMNIVEIIIHRMASTTQCNTAAVGRGAIVVAVVIIDIVVAFTLIELLKNCVQTTRTAKL